MVSWPWIFGSGTQCTMAHLKKCPKVKSYCAPIFDPIMFKPFLDDAKLPRFCGKWFSLSKRSNIGCIFWTCLWKNLKGWSDRLETWHAETLDPLLKKARKQQFYPGSLSLWIWHLKCTNISQIFSLPGSGQKLLDSFFMGFGQLVPFIWFISFPQPVWIATDSLAM